MPAQMSYSSWGYSTPGEAQAQQAAFQGGISSSSAPLVALQSAPHHTAVYQASNSQQSGSAQPNESGPGRLLGPRQNSERGGSGMVGLDDGLMQYFWEHQDPPEGDPNKQ